LRARKNDRPGEVRAGSILIGHVFIDEGVMMTVYRDNDRGGFEEANGQTQSQCHPSPGWVANNYDRDDNDPRKNPITGTCG
jgi:hypothetical protein